MQRSLVAQVPLSNCSEGKCNSLQRVNKPSLMYKKVVNSGLVRWTRLFICTCLLFQGKEREFRVIGLLAWICLLLQVWAISALLSILYGKNL